MADQPKDVPAKPKEKKKRKAEGKSAEAKSAEGKSAEGKPAEGKSAEAKPAEAQPAETKSKQAKPSPAQPPITTGEAKPAKPSEAEPPAATEDAKPAEPKAKPSASKPSSRKASSAAAAAAEGEPQRKASVAEGEAAAPRRKSSAADPGVKQESRKSVSELGTEEREEAREDVAEPVERKMSMATDAERQKKRDSVSLHSKQDMLKDLDEDKLKELMEAFMLFDMDGDGFINMTDLRQTFVTLGQTDVQDDELKKMLKEASNPMDFEAFVLLLGFKTIALDPEEILVEALSQWDYNNSGLISEERIKHDLMTWGDKFSQHEVDWALEEAPTHVTKGNNVMIDYVRFCKTLCGLRKRTRAPVPEDFMS